MLTKEEDDVVICCARSLVLRRARNRSRSGASILQGIEAVNDLDRSLSLEGECGSDGPTRYRAEVLTSWARAKSVAPSVSAGVVASAHGLPNSQATAPRHPR